MAPNLDAYFKRIGYEGPRTASLETLRALHARHPLSIPFENLDVLLGRPIRLDLESVEKKLLGERRGGYCFEQNALFAAVLRALGFQVTTLAARVRWLAPPDAITPRAHMVLRVDLDGAPWLVDVGFGGLTPTAPIRLDVEDLQSTPHEPLRIVRRGGMCMLQTPVGDGWGDVYHFTLEEHHPIDYEVGNWFTSTHPKSNFTQNLIISRARPDGERVSLRNRELVIRRGNVAEKRNLESSDELLPVLAEHFGLRLPEGTRLAAPNLSWST